MSYRANCANEQFTEFDAMKALRPSEKKQK